MQMWRLIESRWAVIDPMLRPWEVGNILRVWRDTTDAHAYTHSHTHTLKLYAHATGVLAIYTGRGGMPVSRGLQRNETRSYLKRFNTLSLACIHKYTIIQKYFITRKVLQSLFVNVQKHQLQLSNKKRKQDEPKQITLQYYILGEFLLYWGIFIYIYLLLFYILLYFKITFSSLHSHNKMNTFTPLLVSNIWEYLRPLLKNKNWDLEKKV